MLEYAALLKTDPTTCFFPVNVEKFFSVPSQGNHF